MQGNGTEVSFPEAPTLADDLSVSTIGIGNTKIPHSAIISRAETQRRNRVCPANFRFKGFPSPGEI
jgi:hypothetical protein